jgi:hypothetical protein
MFSKYWQFRRALPVLLAAAVVVCAMVASSASAALERLSNGQVVSYVPLRTTILKQRPPDVMFNNMDYNGGPVMPSNTDTVVVWAPKGSTAFPAGYVDGVVNYFKNLQADNGRSTNVESIATQYNDATGARSHYDVTYGGLITDTNPYPASECPVIAPNTSCLVDAQIQTELQRVAHAHHLTRDLSHEVFLLTPPDVQGCFTNDPTTNYGFCTAGIGNINLAAYCAYHQQTTKSPMMFYADDPYQFDATYQGQLLCQDGNNPNGYADGALATGLSHEHNESITDPIPNDAWTNGVGANHGEEVGDQCAYDYGTPLGTVNGQKYNQVINGHKYWYQQEWSNDGHTCLQRLTRPSTLPQARFTVTAGSGTAMTFDASGSGPSIADYSWQFNDSPPGCTSTCNSTVETTSPTLGMGFPATGAYSVGLAAFQANGLSAGFGGIVTTGSNGFTPGFTFAPASPAAGTAVRFTALKTISLQPVSNYLWEFGDGTTGSGATPTHTFAQGGTYHVVAVLFSGVGSAYPGSGAAPVVEETIKVS